MVLSPLLPYPSLLTFSWPYFFRPLYNALPGVKPDEITNGIAAA